jgi:hypothetical protein
MGNTVSNIVDKIHIGLGGEKELKIICSGIDNAGTS